MAILAIVCLVAGAMTAVVTLIAAARADASAQQQCDPNYLPCIPYSISDLDCGDINVTVRVIGDDRHNFDREGDGIGCEGNGTTPPRRPAPTPIPPPPTAVPQPTAVPPTAVPQPTAVPPTAVPPPPTAVPPTAVPQPTAIPPTATAIPATATAVPPTPTDVPPTATEVPSTPTVAAVVEEAPTAVPQSDEVLPRVVPGRSGPDEPSDGDSAVGAIALGVGGFAAWRWRKRRKKISD